MTLILYTHMNQLSVWTYHPHCQPDPVVGSRCWLVWSGSLWSWKSGCPGDGSEASGPRPGLQRPQDSAGACSFAGPRCSLEVWGEEAGVLEPLAHRLRRLWGRDPQELDLGSLEGWEGELGNAHPWRGRWHSTLDRGVDEEKGEKKRKEICSAKKKKWYEE